MTSEEPLAAEHKNCISQVIKMNLRDLVRLRELSLLKAFGWAPQITDICLIPKSWTLKEKKVMNKFII